MSDGGSPEEDEARERAQREEYWASLSFFEQLDEVMAMVDHANQADY